MRALLQLVRFPNTLTTVADVLAGAALAGGIPDAGATVRVASTCAAMMALYAFGITLNDWVDREKDARIHPDRALPSGRVTERAARVVMAVTVGAAIALLSVTGLTGLLVGLGVVVSIVLYDAVLPERTLRSTLAMGACRALSMTSGAAAVGRLDALAADLAWAGPATYVVLVASLTLLSTSEEGGPGRRARSTIAVAGIVLALFTPTLLPGATWAVPLAAALLAAWDLLPLTRRPPAYGLAVRNVVFGLPVFCAIVCLAAGAPGLAACAAAVFPLSRLAARVIGQSGS